MGGEKPWRPDNSETWERVEIHGTLNDEQVDDLKKYIKGWQEHYRRQPD